MFAVNDALHVHQAGAVGPGDVFGNCFHVMPDLILGHADRDGLFFYGKHTNRSSNTRPDGPAQILRYPSPSPKRSRNLL